MDGWTHPLGHPEVCHPSIHSPPNNPFPLDTHHRGKPGGRVVGLLGEGMAEGVCHPPPCSTNPSPQVSPKPKFPGERPLKAGRSPWGTPTLGENLGGLVEQGGGNGWMDTLRHTSGWPRCVHPSIPPPSTTTTNPFPLDTHTFGETWGKGWWGGNGWHTASAIPSPNNPTTQVSRGDPGESGPREAASKRTAAGRSPAG